MSETLNTNIHDNLFFFGHSITGELARSIDWTKTDLGPAENWPHELKVILGMMYNNKHPVSLFWGPDFYYFYNDGYIPIVGASKHPHSMGKKGIDVWGEIWEFLIPQINQVMSGGSSTWNEDQYLPVLGDDGVPRDAYFTYSYSPVYLVSGAVGGVLVTCTETTQRIMSDRLLKNRTRQLQMALKVGRFGTFYWNFLEGKASWDQEAYRLFGYGDHNPEVTYDLFKNSIHPDDRLRTLKLVEEAIAHNTPFEAEFRVITEDGSERWLVENGGIFEDEAGTPSYILGTVQDITERKLQQIEFERNLDMSPAMLWITEKDGSCSYLSKQWYQNTGQTPEMGLGFGWLEATHPDDKERTGKIFDEANRTQTPFYVEYRLRHKSGDYRWAIDAGNPRFDTNGEYLGIAGAVFDIHDRIVAEVHSEEARKKAEALSDDLREALRARDEFLSIASHELKTPLTSLRLQSQMFIRSIKKNRPDAYNPESIQEFVYLTDKQTNRLTRLVDDMLDVSRIRSGKLSLRKENFDMKEMVDDVVSRLKDQFLNASYEVPMVQASGDVTGHWDRMRMEQVMNNLLTNAIRYGGGEPISIEIYARSETVCIKVVDRGIGISEENQDKIFDRFERAVNANDISGLGLGLFITKQIVIAHGGGIRIESAMNQGSSFIVEVPKQLSTEIQREVTYEL